VIRHVDLVRAMKAEGLLGRVLLSHDAGWYNPAASDGLPEGGYRGYTALMKDFIPELLRRGVSEEQVHHITVENPARAFAF